MQARARGLTRVLVGIVVILLVVIACIAIPTSVKSRQEQKYPQKHVPTFFLHGWNGSYKSETHMINAAKDAGVSKSVIVANVSPEGKVSLEGKITSHATNPLVGITFEDSKNSDYSLCASWLKNVLVAFEQVYQFQQFNMVAHSMGNMVLMNYLKDYGSDKSLPALQKQVALAGNFNGVLYADDEPNRITFSKEGLPSPQSAEFTALLPLRQSFPYKSVDILNIYGDVGDGTHSDGSVSVGSSQSMRYLINKRAKTYQELKITGPDASHSNLHESDRVDRLMIAFIW